MTKDETEAYEQQAADAREYAFNLEFDLQSVNAEILALMGKNLIPSTRAGESKMLYYKMKGRLRPIPCRVGHPRCEEQAAEDACIAYAQATKLQKIVEFPQVQYVDKTVDVPVVWQGQVPTIQTVQEAVEVPQVQFFDRLMGVPVACKHRRRAHRRRMNEFWSALLIILTSLSRK